MLDVAIVLHNGVLNRERVEAKKERKKKKKRRRRKEKRRRKKEKKRSREDSELGQEMQSQKNRHKDDRKKRSSIYDSSDNSNNRKKARCSPNNFHNHGSHFHFTMQKHKDQAAQSTKPLCSTPVWMDILVQQEFEMDPRLSKEKFCSSSGTSITTAQEMTSRPTREMCHSPSRTEVVADEKSETAKSSSLSKKWFTAYRITRRQPRSDMIRKTNACNDDFCHGSYILYPHAQYLPEADIYALPYNYGHLSWLIIGLQQKYKKLDFGNSQTDAEADLKFIDMVIHQEHPPG
uniref:Uncharacterized protein n=1 Tax=Fagus sylvatica TaxID=28930 RepID=A0A2N9INJ4_FAGSY